MRRIRSVGIAALGLAAAGLALPDRVLGQAVWTGAGADTNATTAGNWSGDTVPVNDGTVTVGFNYSANAQNVTFNTPADYLGLAFTGSPTYFTQYNLGSSGGGSLTLGSGGISLVSGNGEILFLNAPTVLAANQTWSSANGFIDIASAITETGGPRSLTIGNGALYVFGDSTFSGGLTMDSGSYLNVGEYQPGNTTATVGSGTLTLDSGSQIGSWYYDAVIPNPVSLGSSVNVAVGGQTGQFPTLTLSGPLAAQTTSTTLNLQANVTLILAGGLTGPTALTINGLGATLINDSGSLAVISGAFNQVTGLTVAESQAILAPAGNATTSFSSLSPTGIQVGSDFAGYLGLDGTFVQPGAVSGFLSTFGAGIGASINGTLGFDSYFTPGTPNTFTDPVNLSAFTSSTFLGLGSSTYAILGAAAVITPPASGYYANTYVFGGGGGTLVVKSPLADGTGAYGLVMTNAPEPVTLLVQGGATYSGPTTSNGGILIFDSNAPTGGIDVISGYVGYTEQAANVANAQAFVNLFSAASPLGVIGFDSTNPVAPRTISDPIDLSVLFNSDDNPFLGTATAVTLSGTITPAAGTYQFTGVKGGQLTVASQLTGATDVVVIGLSQPIEANQSVSTVLLTNAGNSYGGGTTVYSGILGIASGGALGLPTAPISVPDVDGVTVAPVLEPISGSGTVTVANEIAVGTLISTNGPGLTLGNPSTADMLVLSGVISDYSGPGQIGIQGPVTLSGVNTFTGGTSLTGTGNAQIFVTNASSLGAPTAPLTVAASGSLIPLAAVTLPNPITLSGGNTLTIGSPGNNYLITLDGVISDSSNQGTGYLDIVSNAALNGVNTYSSITTITNATVTIGNASALGTGPVALSNANIDFGFSNPTALDLTGDPGSSVILTSGATLTLNADLLQPEYVFSGAISGDGTNAVVKTGAGTQVVGGTSTYGGGTSINQGVLVAGMSGSLGTGPVTVANGAQLAAGPGATISNAVTLDAGSALAGSGTFSLPGLGAGGVIVGGGTTVMPGIAVAGQYTAELSFTTPMTFAPGGIYGFNMETASGVAGTDYGTLSISGSLTISATAMAPFTINLVSIGSGGAPGLANFNAALPYSWTLATTGGVVGFSAADFNVDTGGFQNSLAGGSLQVGLSGNDLTLNFTPVPEPGEWSLMAAGLAGLAGWARRRRRAG